jgi:hypothetical protein
MLRVPGLSCIFAGTNARAAQTGPDMKGSQRTLVSNTKYTLIGTIRGVSWNGPRFYAYTQPCSRIWDIHGRFPGKSAPR